jgi:hypothetical protein
MQEIGYIIVLKAISQRVWALATRIDRESIERKIAPRHICTNHAEIFILRQNTEEEDLIADRADKENWF